MRYEHRRMPPLNRGAFYRRLAAHSGFAGLVIIGSLGFGMWGYHRYERLGWLDAFLNAAMLLGGMGPVNAPQTSAGKIFAGVYALFAGLIFIAVAGLLFAPVFHRILHHFHWELDRTS